MSSPALNIPNLLDVRTTALASGFSAVATRALVRSSISERFRELTGALKEVGQKITKYQCKIPYKLRCEPVQLDDCDAVWAHIEIGEGGSRCGEGTSKNWSIYQALAS